MAGAVAFEPEAIAVAGVGAPEAEEEVVVTVEDGDAVGHAERFRGWGRGCAIGAACRSKVKHAAGPGQRSGEGQAGLRAVVVT